jgi:hypothetical protein
MTGHFYEGGGEEAAIRKNIIHLSVIVFIANRRFFTSLSQQKSVIPNPDSSG